MNSTCNSLKAAHAHHLEYVDLLLPATAPPPEPARRINFFKALGLYWLMPRRFGPHLAVGTWKRAWAAHVLAVVLTAAIAAAWYVDFSGLHTGSLHDLRVQAAEWVIVTAAGSASVPWWVPPLIVIGGPLGLQLVLILVAVVLMPWCAGGDSAWSVFKRSLKNVYWSTTIWPLMALAFGWLGSLNDREWYRRLTELQGACLILVVVGVVWILLLRALLVGAGRYVGPADGPAFRPREPLCDRCGYRITGLPLSGNCPECGLPVRESLPGGRRKPNDWQKHQFRPRGLIEAARLQWRVLRGPGFFERLPVHESPATARHFWWATFMLILLGTLIAGWAVTGALAVGGREYTREVLGARILIGLCMMLIPFSLQTLITFAACLWSQFRLGMRDYRVSATVCCYASPLMWPVIATLFVGCIGLPALGNSGFMGDRRIAFLGLQMVYGDLVALGYCCLVIGSLGYWATRLGRALRSVRHANV